MEIRKKSGNEYLTSENILAYALVHEEGTKKHQQYIKLPVNNSVQKTNHVKNEPILNRK